MKTQRVRVKRNRAYELESAVNDLVERGYVELKRGFHEGEAHVQLKMNGKNKLGGRKQSVYSGESETTDIIKEFHWVELERTEESFNAWLQRREGLS